MSRRGATLVEMLLASSLLALVSALLFVAWEMGAKSWLTASRQSERLSRIQLTLLGLEKALSSTSSTSITSQNSPGILAFPTGYPSKTVSSSGYTYQNSGSPLWQRYACYYLDSSSRTLRLREIPIATSNAAAQSPTPLTSFNDGSGLHALTHYATGGEVLAQNIDSFAITLGPLSVEVTVNSTIPAAAGSAALPGGGLISLRSTTFVRN